MTPYQKRTLKMLILRPSLKIAMHHERYFWKAYGDPCPPPSKCTTLRTPGKMMTILNDPYALTVICVLTERFHATAHCVQEEPNQGGGASTQVWRLHRGNYRGTVTLGLLGLPSYLNITQISRVWHKLCDVSVWSSGTRTILKYDVSLFSLQYCLWVFLSSLLNSFVQRMLEIMCGRHCNYINYYSSSSPSFPLSGVAGIVMNIILPLCPVQYVLLL